MIAISSLAPLFGIYATLYVRSLSHILAEPRKQAITSHKPSSHSIIACAHPVVKLQSTLAFFLLSRLAINRIDCITKTRFSLTLYLPSRFSNKPLRYPYSALFPGRHCTSLWTTISVKVRKYISVHRNPGQNRLQNPERSRKQSATRLLMAVQMNGRPLKPNGLVSKPVGAAGGRARTARSAPRGLASRSFSILAR
jgi:hypothetical protein